MPDNAMLPKPGQHVIARRGESRLEGTVKQVIPEHPLVVVSLPSDTELTTLEYDLWDWDGWTYEVVPEASAHVVVDGALA